MGGIKSTDTDANGDDFITVTLQDTHKTVPVYPYKWEVFTYTMQNGKLISEPLGSFTQYPFRLAWAITIHKSQGKTFDKVTIDLGNRVFTGGQAYVALSRCTALSGISLTTPIEKKHIRTDPRIYKFLTSYAYQKASEDLSFDDKLDIIGKAIADSTKLHMTYLKANDTKSQRVIMPLTLGDESYKGHDFVGMQAYCTIRK